MSSSSYKQVQPAQLDWLSFADPDAIHAPHADLFEADLEASLFGVDQSQLQFLNLDFNQEPFHYFRNSNPVDGPPSTITLSSESTYEDSLYSYPRSPTTYSNIDSSVYSNDLSLNFSKFTVESTDPAVAAPQPLNPTANSLHLLDDSDSDPNSFGELPISPYDSVSSCSSFVEFDNNQTLNATSITPADFYLQPNRHVASAPQRVQSANIQSISPINMLHPFPRLTLQMSEAHSSPSPSSMSQDGRRKYQCPNCPRAFARAYNLKTHMATHDPARPKPFICPHKSCARSFSRKHDLGRHLVSIHHDSPDDKKIGVENGSRQWCDSCGKGWTSASSACGCET